MNVDFIGFDSALRQVHIKVSGVDVNGPVSYYGNAHGAPGELWRMVALRNCINMILSDLDLRHREGRLVI